MGGEGVKLVEFLRQEFGKGLILTCPERIEFGGELGDAVVEFGNFIRLTSVRLQQILVFFMEVLELMLQAFDVFFFPLPKSSLRCSVLGTPSLPCVSACSDD